MFVNRCSYARAYDTSFGDYLFYNCSSLESITLPSELKKIGSYCFTGCTSLTNVDFDRVVNGAIDPEGTPDADGNPARIAGTGRKLKEIRAYAFGASAATVGTPAFEKIVIPSTVEAIGVSAFGYNESLKEVEFEYNTLLTVIGDYAFTNCINLEKVNLNNLPNLTFIGSYTFRNCISLKTFAVDTEGNTTNKFPDQMVALGAVEGSATVHSQAYVFDGCTDLETVDLNNVTRIGGWVFRNCSSLRTVIGLENATVLGTCSFFNTAIEEVTFGSKVTAYGYGMFAECIGLRKATVEKGGLTYFGGNNASTTLTTFTAGYFNHGPFTGCIALTEVTLPDNITVIQPYTFANCTDLKTINFGTLSKLVTICSYAFYNTALEEADLSACPLTVIGSYAFARAESLRNVTLPTSTLTTIGIGAFEGDVGLTTVKLPSSVTTINDYAFRNAGLTEFTVPSGLTKLGNLALAENKIATYKSDNSNYRIGRNGELIQIVSDGDDVVVGIPVTFGGVYTFENGTAPGYYFFAVAAWLTGVVLPEGMTELPAYSFAGFDGVVKIPDTITSIGAYAFYGAKLGELVIPEGVISIGYRAFAYATIDKLVIPSTVEKVGQNLCESANIREFEYNVPAAIWTDSAGKPLATNGAASDSNILYGVSGLKKVTVGEGVKYVGKYFIKGATECDATVYFPDGMDVTQGYLICDTQGCKFDVRLPADATKLGARSFARVNTVTSSVGLTEFKMTIPDGVNDLPMYLFGACVINDVVLPSNLKTINHYAFYYCFCDTELVIPNTVESIGGYSFYYGSYSHVTFEEGLENIYITTLSYRPMPQWPQLVVNVSTPFSYATISEMTLPSTLKSIPRCFLAQAKGPSQLVLPEGLISVGDVAFSQNTHLLRLYLPSTVEAVSGAAVFQDWTANQTIYSPMSRTATMSVWGPSLTNSLFKGTVVYNYVPTTEQTEKACEIAIEGEVAFIAGKQD